MNPHREAHEGGSGHALNYSNATLRLAIPPLLWIDTLWHLLYGIQSIDTTLELDRDLPSEAPKFLRTDDLRISQVRTRENRLERGLGKIDKRCRIEVGSLIKPPFSHLPTFRAGSRLVIWRHLVGPSYEGDVRILKAKIRITRIKFWFLTNYSHRVLKCSHRLLLPKTHFPS